MPSLTELVESAGAELHGNGNVTIEALTADSRQVQKNTLFAALRGLKVDGLQFVDSAVEKGAVAILSDAAPTRSDIAWVKASNARAALAHMAAAFYAPQPSTVVAVTGTDGKTSTADFTRQLWQLTGREAAAIGTLGVTGVHDAARFPAIHTTPDPILLHRTMQTLAKEGIDHVAMEASSHGLNQFRLDGVKLKAAAFTNLTRDHLDYHATVEDYYAAKKRLFAELLPEGTTAVINADDARFPDLKATCHARRIRVVSFGKHGEAFKIRTITPHADGQEAIVDIYGGKRTLALSLIGEFQVMNVVAAIGLVVAAGCPLDAALKAVPSLKGVPGRLEKAAVTTKNARIYVDYAHTPAALAKVLTTIRPHVERKLWVVFGCGGDRDKGKRPEMGKVAAEWADHAIVTDDNPRSEDPASIRQAIMAAAAGAEEVGDRRAAIARAIEQLQAGDVLVIAGKGHEKTQIVGNQVLPFDDVAVAKEIAGVTALAS